MATLQGYLFVVGDGRTLASLNEAYPPTAERIAAIFARWSMAERIEGYRYGRLDQTWRRNETASESALSPTKFPQEAVMSETEQTQTDQTEDTKPTEPTTDEAKAPEAEQPAEPAGE